MATIKAIEAKSVHQIQSGQVIVDLCSVVKELVENSLDAEATSIEVRFKNNGLDSIEVQDNGSGISSSNYTSIALKHHTSKLSKYDDLSTLQTFGFRGEALSSLCALSNFSITTAQANEAPKGNRLEFKASGALKNTTTVASQKGTTATVESLFEKLPVRQKELAKNIKREYGKVLSLLHAYACVGVNVKFTVKNSMPKAKSMVVFSTNGNPATRDNIANVYGAKTLSALVSLDLELDFQPTLTQMSREGAHIAKVIVRGHISRPVFGEGRQTPDRQMFFVNGRPCGLPQVQKAINEVYKSFNVTQSPFIFADFIMDTNAYDVNVSPDKRTILLHNAANLIERLKTCLTEMFDKQDQTVPQSQLQTPKLPGFKQLIVNRQPSMETPPNRESRKSSESITTSRLQDEINELDTASEDQDGTNRLLHNHFWNVASTRDEEDVASGSKTEPKLQKAREKQAEKIARAIALQEEVSQGVDKYDDVRELGMNDTQQDSDPESPQAIQVRDFNARIAEQQLPKTVRETERPREQAITVVAPVTEKDAPGLVQNAFDRMRPKRVQAQIATITIGDETTTQVIGTQLPNFGNEARKKATSDDSVLKDSPVALSKFSQGIRRFGAPGMEIAGENSGNKEKDVTESTAEESMSRRSSASDSTKISDENDTQDVANADDEESVEDESDEEYQDEEEKKAEEVARVAELIRAAEESAALPSKENLQRANRALKGGQTRDSTTSLLATLDLSMERLRGQMRSLRQAIDDSTRQATASDDEGLSAKDEESQLSLTVSKDDFANMEIAGQFNLGFILGVRRRSADDQTGHAKDELFIIDQHASDEKFNFERLQAETVVGNQRMVQPVTLNLTAVEEEVVLENTVALEKNGFIVNIDTSGTAPVGRRVTLISLPLSKEAVFDTRDLDELIHLLSETPMLSAESTVPRPSRVRKMFAMRACRSSIMIGKTMSKKQMKKVVVNMGTMEKPWNCPHGRPTMRHLTSLDDLSFWEEGDGVTGWEDRRGGGTEVWKEYLAS